MASGPYGTGQGTGRTLGTSRWDTHPKRLIMSRYAKNVLPFLKSPG